MLLSTSTTYMIVKKQCTLRFGPNLYPEIGFCWISCGSFNWINQSINQYRLMRLKIDLRSLLTQGLGTSVDYRCKCQNSKSSNICDQKQFVFFH